MDLQTQRPGGWPGLHIFCARVCKPNSVLPRHSPGGGGSAFAEASARLSSNLSGPCITARLERHSRHTCSVSGTALHSGKDLAVSPPPCGGTRLCSHLLRPQRAHDGRYPLPLPGKTGLSVRTFLPAPFRHGATTRRADAILAQFYPPPQCCSS